MADEIVDLPPLDDEEIVDLPPLEDKEEGFSFSSLLESVGFKTPKDVVKETTPQKPVVPFEQTVDANLLLDRIANEATRATVGEGMGLAARAASTAFAPLAIPGAALANATGRLTDDFINPEILRRARRAEGFPATFDEAYKKAREGGVIDTTHFLFNEVFPLSQGMSSNISDPIWNEAADSVAETLGMRGAEDDLKAIMKFSTDVVSDPTMWFSFMQKIPQKTAAAASAKEALQGVEQEFLKKAKQGKGFGPEIQRGERAALALDIPFLKKVPIIKGQKAGEFIDAVDTSLRSLDRSLVRTNTGLGFDDLDYAYEARNAANSFAIQEARDTIMKQAGYNNINVNKLASYMAESGSDDVGIALAKKRGVRVNPDDVEDAKQLAASYRKVLDEATRVVEKETGFQVKQIGLPSPEVQDKVIKKAKSQFGEIPIGLVELEDGRTVDVTFSNSYDFGRRFSEMSEAAKGIKVAENELANAAKGTGFAARPDALKQRNPLSTFMLEELYAKKYGIKPEEVYSWNKPSIVADTYENLVDFASDFKLLKETKDTYGVAKADIESYIQAAKDRASMAKLMGMPPSKEDLLVAKMSPKDFVPIDNRVFDKMRMIVGDDVSVVIPQKLYYPKEIADRVNMRFFKADKNAVAQSASWLMNLWSRNALTSATRIGKQSFENISKSFQMGVTPSTFIEESAQAVRRSLGKDVDATTKLMDSLPSINENLFTDVTPKGRVPFNPKLMDDEVIAGPYKQTLRTFHDLAKTNGKKMLSPKWWAEYIGADNPISTFIRKTGSASDTYARRAHFRQMIKDGYSPGQAMQLTNQRYMDFSRRTPVVEKGLRTVSPFSSFLLKNLEALPSLIAKRPGTTNIINPWDGHLARAFEDWSGWSPEASEGAQKLIPFYQDEILGPVLKGSQAIIDDRSWVKNFMNEWSSKWLPEGGKQGLEAGYLFSLKLPSAMSAVAGIDPSSSFTSPFVASAMLGFLGYDPVREKMIATSGTTLEGLDRISLALRELNPVDHPKFMNLVVAPWVKENLPKIREAFNSPVGNVAQKIIGLKFPQEANKLEQAKVDDLTVKTLTSLKFFGLGRVDKADYTYMMRQLALMGKLESQLKLLNNPQMVTNKQEVARIVGGARELGKQIRANTLIYKDYRTLANGVRLDPETQAVISQSLEMDEETDGLDVQEEEFEELPDLDEEAEEELPEIGGGREPQSEKRRTPKEDMDYVLSWPLEWAQQYDAKTYDRMVREEVARRANEVFGEDIRREPDLIPIIQDRLQRKLNPENIRRTLQGPQERRDKEQGIQRDLASEEEFEIIDLPAL